MQDWKPSWTIAKEWHDAETGVAVQVSVSDHKPLPRYSVTAGRRKLDGEGMLRHFRPTAHVRREGGRVVDVRVDAIEPLIGFLIEARDWIARDAWDRARAR